MNGGEEAKLILLLALFTMSAFSAADAKTQNKGRTLATQLLQT